MLIVELLLKFPRLDAMFVYQQYVDINRIRHAIATSAKLSQPASVCTLWSWHFQLVHQIHTNAYDSPMLSHAS